MHEEPSFFVLLLDAFHHVEGYRKRQAVTEDARPLRQSEQVLVDRIDGELLLPLTCLNCLLNILVKTILVKTMYSYVHGGGWQSNSVRGSSSQPAPWRSLLLPCSGWSAQEEEPAFVYYNIIIVASILNVFRLYRNPI